MANQTNPSDRAAARKNRTRRGGRVSMLSYMKGYRLPCLLAPTFKLLEALLELLVPLVVARIIDVGIAEGDLSFVLKNCLILLALGAIGLGFSVTAQYFAAKAAVGYAGAVRHALFAHIQTLSYPDLDAAGSSALITRMTSDSLTLQNGVNLGLRLLLRSPFVVFGAMIMAFTVDAGAASIFVLVIPLLFAAVFAVMLPSLPLYRRVQGKLDRVLAATREDLSGVRVVRAFRREKDEIREFERENDALAGMQKFVGRIAALLNPVTYILINGAILLLLYTGALKIDAGSLTQGQLVALYNYMSQILVELIKLASLIISVTRAAASGSRIRAVLETSPSMTYGEEELPPGDGPAPAVVFSEVSLTYPGAGAPALSGISFTAAAGETIGVLGGTGSGKSSLVRLIGRFYDVTGGQVSLFGKDVKRYTKNALRRAVAIAPQKATLFSGTLRENLGRGDPCADDGEMLAALAVAQAKDFVLEKGGLDLPVGQGGRNLSGGQKQRLTVARALLRKARILILDDSSSALDYATDAAMRESLRKSLSGVTTFLVSQRAASVMHADRIIVLDEGRAVGIGRHEELLRNCPVYREIYETQFSSGKEAGV